MMNLFKGIVLVTAVFAAGGGTASAGNIGIPSALALKNSIEHQTKGNMLDEEGRTLEALHEYRVALSYNPGDTNTLFNMGTVYLKINRPTEAVRAFEDLLEIDSRDTEAYNLLGLAYRGCGRIEDAVRTWEKSLSIDPAQTMPRKFIEEALSASASASTSTGKAN